MNLPFEKKDPSDFLIFTLLLQIFLIVLGARVYNYYFYGNVVAQNIFLIIIFSNFLLVIFVVKEISQLKARNFYNSKNILFMEDTLKILRSERHDYINHIQSILGLIVNDEKQLAHAYIKDISEVSRFNSIILNIKNIGLRVLLQNKRGICASKEIKFQVVINSSLDFLTINISDITTIFGNLIDNAIDSVISQQSGEKFIKLTIDEITDYYVLMLADSGPKISQSVQDEMFKEGFSTKGTNRGIGMRLIKDTLHKYGGKIDYRNDDKCFTMFIPKEVNNDPSISQQHVHLFR